MSAASARSKPRAKTPTGRRAPNRPSAVSEAIKSMIRDHAMQPGERLPQEPDLIGAFGVSKGTIREALKMLETQGLIQMRTGPGGGAFITDIPAARARALVANYFFFKGLSISDIYDMRQALEPELAAELATHLGDGALAVLNDAMVEYDHPPATIEEEQRQRIAELEFHERLAEFSNNPLLGFTCGFLAALLKDLAVCRRIYRYPNPQLRERGFSYQTQLLEALRAGDPETARSIMKAHMRAARRMMTAQEAVVNRDFLQLAPERKAAPRPAGPGRRRRGPRG